MSNSSDKIHIHAAMMKSRPYTDQREIVGRRLTLYKGNRFRYLYCDDNYEIDRDQFNEAINYLRQP